MTQDNPKKYTVKCDEADCNEFYYARGKCRRHYKMLLGREGGYIKDYQRVKDRPEYKEMKRKSDRAYREKLRNIGVLSDKYHETYLKYISKSGNRDLKNIRESIRRKNRTQTQKWRDNATMRLHNDVVKYEVMYHYSNGKLCCMNCGIDIYPLLTIDHINNDGANHRREITKGKCLSSSTYRWLRSHNYPQGFQVLCQNCNYFKDMIIRIERPTKR
jgi:hypothetical protein